MQYIDKTKKRTKYVPELNVELLPYDDALWKRKFMYQKDLDYRSLQMTNIGKYSIASPQMGAQLVAFIKELNERYIHKDPNQLVCTESHGGIGGFTLPLALAFTKVNTVEINPVHANIIVNNLKVYGVTSDVHIEVADYMDIMYDIPNDVIVCDPPWGGMSYGKKKSMQLGINNINVVCVINDLYKRKAFKAFILLAAINYDIQNFVSSIIATDIVIKRLGKHYFIAVLRD